MPLEPVKPWTYLLANWHTPKTVYWSASSPLYEVSVWVNINSPPFTFWMGAMIKELIEFLQVGLFIFTSFLIWARISRTGKTFNICLIFLERQSRCGLWNEGIKLWSSVAFPKWMGDLNYWRKKFEKSIFMDFFDGFFERFSHYIEKHVNLSIENLLLYDTYEFFVAYYERENGLNFLKHPQFK